MASKFYRDERKRAFLDYPENIGLLHAKWPKAFPRKSHWVRPLASNIVRPIADAFGWSMPYTRSVIERWKQRDAYCRAVIAYSKRITLEGLENGEEVDDQARTNAKQRMEEREQRQRQRLTKEKPAVSPDAATHDAA
jgi:sRNA-binding protein